MNAEDILLRLIEDVRDIVEPHDPEGMHKANCPDGDECTTCHLMREIRPVLDEAENDLTRVRLGVS